MDPTVFRRLSSIAYERAGICLPEGKQSLMTARVARRLRALHLSSEKEYLEYLEADLSEQELVLFLDAVSTNVTSFLRESDHFELLRQFVCQRVAEGSSRFRLWCAASSTGEEPYTIAMTLEDALAGQNLDVRILATDLSTGVLAAAQAGVYEPERLEPLPHAWRSRYFERFVEEDKTLFRVVAELRQKIVFRRLNLATPPFPIKGPLEAVFCRNVMIYFDREVKQRLIREIERVLAPGGLLFIGHSETLGDIPTRLKRSNPSVYVMT